MNIVKPKPLQINAGMILDSFASRFLSHLRAKPKRNRSISVQILAKFCWAPTSLQSPLRAPEVASTPKIPKVNVETAIKSTIIRRTVHPVGNRDPRQKRIVVSAGFDNGAPRLQHSRLPWSTPKEISN